MADAVYAKQIYVNYQGAPAWNTPLNFIFWLCFSLTSGIIAYLFSMFIFDTSIKADNAAGPPGGPPPPPSTQGAHQGNPNAYGNVVELNIKTIPFFGSIFYP